MGGMGLWWSVIYSLATCRIVLFLNSVPLSVNITRGVSHLFIMSSLNNSQIFFSFADLEGAHSIHFVKRSCITNMYSNCALLRGRGPIMSAAITIHGSSTTRQHICPAGADWYTLHD